MESPGLCERVWQLSDASVRGKSHVQAELPNQDSVFVTTDRSGEVVCAVVSDGAGTAPRAQEGSNSTARWVAERLCAAGERMPEGPLVAGDLRPILESAIEGVRAQFAQQGELSQFHCTLVAWLFTPGGSFIAQVGDSVALTTRFGIVGHANGRALDFFPEGRHTLYEIERGEYSNETHFITEDDWREHLRISEIQQDVDAVILMSDGAMDVAMLRGEVFRGFLANLIAKLINTPTRAERNRTIHDWLEDPKTNRVTGDDKTVFVGIRCRRRKLEDATIFLGQRHDDAAASPSASVAARWISAPESPRRSQVNASGSIAPPSRTSASSQRVFEGRSPGDAPRISVSNRVLIATVVLVTVLLALSIYWVLPRATDRAEPKLTAEKHFQAIGLLPDDPSRQVPANGGRDASVAIAKSQTEGEIGSPLTPSIQQTRKYNVAVSGSAQFEKGAALGMIHLRDGPPLTITRITPDPELSIDTSRPNSCRVGLQLRQGTSCKMHVSILKKTRPGEYGIEVKLQNEDDGGVLSRSIVFGWSGSAAASGGR